MAFLLGLQTCGVETDLRHNWLVGLYILIRFRNTLMGNWSASSFSPLMKASICPSPSQPHPDVEKKHPRCTKAQLHRSLGR